MQNGDGGVEIDGRSASSAIVPNQRKFRFANTFDAEADDATKIAKIVQAVDLVNQIGNQSRFFHLVDP